MDNIDNTKNFAFVLGRERELALAELKAVLSRFSFCFSPFDGSNKPLGVGIFSITDNIAFANIDDFAKSDAIRVMEALGGTTKIFAIIPDSDLSFRANERKSRNLLKDLSASVEMTKGNVWITGGSIGMQNNRNVSQDIINLIKNINPIGKTNLGISWYSKNKPANLLKFGLEQKKHLRSLNINIRFVESKENELSTILSTKNDLDDGGIEIGIFDDCIGVLLAVSNPYEWSKRDYGKPASDKRSGMLPPKLARMMINLALGQIDQARSLVVDPFCGSGNILMEAMMLGCDVFGSDISERAVSDSTKNINWLIQSSSVSSSASRGGKLKTHPSRLRLAEAENHNLKVKVVQSDATKDDFNSLIENYKLKIVNYDRVAIVAEPYLGEPKKFKPTLNAAKGEYKKIKELYINFLKNLSTFLPRLAEGETGNFKLLTIVIVFPLVETTDGERYSLFKECVDEIKNLGYTQVCKFIYGRDYQVVKREIILLSLNAKVKYQKSK